MWLDLSVEKLLLGGNFRGKIIEKDTRRSNEDTYCVPAKILHDKFSTAFLSFLSTADMAVEPSLAYFHVNLQSNLLEISSIESYLKLTKQHKIDDFQDEEYNLHHRTTTHRGRICHRR